MAVSQKSPIPPAVRELSEKAPLTDHTSYGTSLRVEKRGVESEIQCILDALSSDAESARKGRQTVGNYGPWMPPFGRTISCVKSCRRDVIHSLL